MTVSDYQLSLLLLLFFMKLIKDAIDKNILLIILDIITITLSLIGLVINFYQIKK